MHERLRYACIHVIKAAHGAITSEKHSRKEAGTHLLCVLTFNTPPELYLELRKTKENGKLRTIVQSAKNAYY